MVRAVFTQEDDLFSEVAVGNGESRQALAGAEPRTRDSLGGSECGPSRGLSSWSPAVSYTRTGGGGK